MRMACCFLATVYVSVSQMPEQNLTMVCCRWSSPVHGARADCPKPICCHQRNTFLSCVRACVCVFCYTSYILAHLVHIVTCSVLICCRLVWPRHWHPSGCQYFLSLVWPQNARIGALMWWSIRFNVCRLPACNHALQNQLPVYLGGSGHSHRSFRKDEWRNLHEMMLYTTSS